MVLVFGALIPGNPQAAKGAAVGLFTYIAFFGATWLPLPWLYPAEINPIKTRAKANAISTSTNWLFNFLIVMITPVMIANISWGTYLLLVTSNSDQSWEDMLTFNLQLRGHQRLLPAHHLLLLSRSG